MKAVGEHFSSITVTLDAGDFEDCVFENCKIIFHGLHGFRMVGCHIKNFQVLFEGPAASTIRFLTMMYRMGPGGEQFVSELFDVIRQPLPEDEEREV